MFMQLFNFFYMIFRSMLQFSEQALNFLLIFVNLSLHRGFLLLYLLDF